METLDLLLENNQKWAGELEQQTPGFFLESSKGQSPQYLWIGCADSRVPPNQLLGLGPGEVFVHRNIANLVTPGDLSVMSVIQYAVGALKVRHIIVCGHYGCGGINAVIHNQAKGGLSQWLEPAAQDHQKHSESLQGLSEEAHFDKFCEINVKTQVQHVAESDVVQAAWAQGQALSVHGWIYQLKQGTVKELGICVSSSDELAALD